MPVRLGVPESEIPLVAGIDLPPAVKADATAPQHEQLWAMSKSQLLDYAEKRGIPVSRTMLKASIVDAIEGAKG